MNEKIHGAIKAHEDQIDFIARKMIEHDEQFHLLRDTMVTKDDIRSISDTLDTLVGLIKKEEQEVTMLSYGMKRHEDKIEALKEEVHRLKTTFDIEI